MSFNGECVHYRLLVEDIIKYVGKGTLEVLNLLEHGHSKRAIAKLLKKPYPEVRDIVLKIKAHLIKVGEIHLNKKVRRSRAKK
jgi:dihydroneopterin aldolase